LGTGALTGAATGLILGGALGNIAIGVAGGLIGAVPFVPAGGLLVAAGRRAQRARGGSIVARSDRRAFVSLIAVILGCASLLALLDWPAAASGLGPSPLDAVALAVAAALVVLVTMIADLISLARLNRLGCDDDDAALSALMPEAAAGPVRRVDMGLGDE